MEKIEYVSTHLNIGFYFINICGNKMIFFSLIS